MREVWKSVDELDGYYEVSNFGVVRRAKAGVSTYVGRVMKPYVDSDGYYTVQPCINGNYIHCKVHRLVAAAFIGPCPVGRQVNHKDLDKANNCSNNLEYTTAGENLFHAIKNGVKVGGRMYVKLSWEDVQKIRLMRNKFTAAELAKQFGVSPVTVWRIVADRERLSA